MIIIAFIVVASVSFCVGGLFLGSWAAKKNHDAFEAMRSSVTHAGNIGMISRAAQLRILGNTMRLINGEPMRERECNFD